MPVASNKFQQGMASNPNNIYGFTKNPAYDNNWNPIPKGPGSIYSTPIFPPYVGNVNQVTPRSTLDSTAKSASERQQQLIADGQVLRVIYGRDRLGAQLADLLAYQGKWVYLIVWGEGGLERLETIEADDKALPTGMTVKSYGFDSVGIGTLGSGVDATLVGAYAESGITYADALDGIAYTVITATNVDSGAMPNFTATIKGRKLFDPRDVTQTHGVYSTYKWSDNPALALGDFSESTLYGMCRSVNWASVAEAAKYCDTADAPYYGVVGGKPRRSINLAIDTPKKGSEWRDTLSTYAGCWTVDFGGEVYLIPDRPATYSHTFRHEDGQIAKINGIKKRGILDIPTLVEVKYTDTSVVPWRERSAIAKMPGVDAGATPRRPSTVQLPGIQTYAQAMREAIERLNKLTLGDLTVDIDVFDEAIAVEIGDVVRVSLPVGIADKDFRVLGVSGQYGRYRLSLTEYDPLMYSDHVESEPSIADTNLPNPSNPPAISGLTVTEEVFQKEDGSWKSRIRAKWTPAVWQYLSQAYVEVWDGTTLVTSGVVSNDATITVLGVTYSTFASPEVQEGRTYTIRVCLLSMSGAYGPVSEANLTAAGKAMLPGNVPYITAFEVGGEVRVTIAAATDMDLKFYELRYDNGTKINGVGGETWETIWNAAKFLDATPAASGVGGFITTKSIPTGTWRLLVCALDSVNQYSPVPATYSVTVTLDIGSYLVDNHEFTNPTLTGMVEYKIPGDQNRYFVTEDGVSAATKFPSVASTYTDIAATYHASQTSLYETEAYDFGLVLSGNWTGEVDSTALSGTKLDFISLSPTGTGGSYVDQSALTAKANARFGKVKSQATGLSTLKVKLPRSALRIDAIPRVETGSVNTPLSGPATVTLANDYANVKTITVTPIGTTSLQAVVDSIDLVAKTFDIYLFDTVTGAQVAGTVMWSFEGV